MQRKFNIGFPSLSKATAIHGVLLLFVLLGVALRFIGLNWDAGFHLHPDERFLCIITPQLRWPTSWMEYFQTSLAPLNPFNGTTDFFVYGQLPLLLVKAVAAALGRDDYQNILLVGRTFSACLDSATMLLVFLIGRQTGSTRLGLLAATLLGFTALHIQHAHFFVVDSFATFFIVASFHFAIAAYKKSSLPSATLCGGFLGAAIACKFSSILFLILLSLFSIFNLKKSNFRLNRILIFRHSLLVIATTFLSFRLLHPIAFRGEGGVLTLWGFLDWRPHSQFWNALAYQQKITSGEVEVPFNLQWFERAPYLWPLQNLGNWALGWPLLICVALGIAFIIAGVLRKRAVPAVVIFAALWCFFVFAFYGAQFSKFTRYYLVATPFAALIAAWFLLELNKATHLKTTRIPAALFTLGVLGSTTAWALAVTSIDTREHPRVAATKWIAENIPPGTTIANETAWDESLPLGDASLWPARNLDLFAPDNTTKRENLLQVLDDTQWILISSPRALKTIPRLPARFPLTTKYYRALFDGSLGFRLEKEFVSTPRLGNFELRDDHVEEALTVYDHPRVLLFAKTKNYNPGKVRVLLPAP